MCIWIDYTVECEFTKCSLNMKCFPSYALLFSCKIYNVCSFFGAFSLKVVSGKPNMYVCVIIEFFIDKFTILLRLLSFC